MGNEPTKPVSLPNALLLAIFCSTTKYCLPASFNHIWLLTLDPSQVVRAFALYSVGKLGSVFGRVIPNTEIVFGMTLVFGMTESRTSKLEEYDSSNPFF